MKGRLYASLAIGLAAWSGFGVALAAEPAARPVTMTFSNQDPHLRGLVEQLQRVGEQQVQAKDSKQFAAHALQQAEITAKILAGLKKEERDPWIRFMASCLASAAVNSSNDDDRAMAKLRWMSENLTRMAPGSDLAAHVVYLELQTEHSLNLAVKNAEPKQAEEHRRQRLQDFVKLFPRCEDTPAALAELARGSLAQKKNDEAVTYLQQISHTFPNHPLAAKAKGTAARLEWQGKELDVVLPLLNDANELFDIRTLQSQAIVVYCWASTDADWARDCEVLQRLWDEYASKGLNVVMVNLDRLAANGRKAAQELTLPVVHLHPTRGLESSWAKEHGIADVPVVFLVGPEGKIVSEDVTRANLEEQVKKLLGPKKKAAKN